MPEPRPVRELIEAGALQIGDGYRAKNAELGEPGLPFARAGNVQRGFDFAGADRLREDRLAAAGNKISMPWDVVFTSKGTVGRFAQVREDTPPFVYSPQLCFWRVLNREEIDPGFLFFWMQSPTCVRQFRALQSQTDMADYISLRDQRTVLIALPSIDKQRAIAADLEVLAHAVYAHRRMSDVLEELLRAALPAVVDGRIALRSLPQELLDALGELPSLGDP